MEYLIHIAIIFAIYGGLALSLNLIVGYTGLLSVTQAAFYGIGAYVTAIMLTSTVFTGHFFLSLVVGAILSAIVAWFIGLVMSRFNDDYYALVSFGFNIIVYSIFLNWQEVTRGPLGIPAIGRPIIFGIELTENWMFLILCLVIGGIMYFASYLIVSSSFGRVLKAIREDEKALSVFGYKTHNFKLAIFVIGAAMAGICGSLFASYITFIDPSTFSLNESIFILAVIILGGLANLRGSILGALVLILLPEILRFVGFPTDIAAQMRQAVYGLMLVLLMIYRPQGMLGEFKL